MGGIDRPLAVAEQKCYEKKMAEEKRKELWHQELVENDMCVASASTETNDFLRPESEDSCDEVLPVTPNRSHKRSIESGLEVFIHYDFLKSPKVVQSLLRNKITPTAISAVMHDIIESVDGDPKKLNLCYKTVQRYMTEGVQLVNEKIKEDRTPPEGATGLWICTLKTMLTEQKYQHIL